MKVTFEPHLGRTMAINFNDKVLVVNPTTFFIGRSVLSVGIIAIAVGVITQFTGDFLLPANLWLALSIPTTVAGAMVLWSSLRKN
jgi:hypothetical protein